jgi:hypothetical protein
MNRFLARFLCVLMLLAGPAVRSQSLINLDFGGRTATTRSGPAGVGFGTNDVWNAYSHYAPRYVPGLPPAPNGRMEALRFSDGAPSQVAIAVTNAPGVWGNSSGDPMLDSFVFAPNGSNLVVTVTGLDPGRYHVLLYGHADADVAPEQNSVFSLRTEGARPAVFGPLTTAGASGWKAGQPWVEGREYVVFRDVAVFTNEPVVIEVGPGPGGVAVLNGLQILSRGTAPPRPEVTETPAPTGAVTNLLFRAIRYEGSVSGGEARFQVAVEVESRSTNELSSVLFDGDVALLTPRLPAGWRIVNSGRRFTLVAGASGAHTLEFELVAKVTRAEPWNEIAFTGPPAAIASVGVTGPVGAEIQLLSGTVLEEDAEKQGGPRSTAPPVVRGALGADPRLALRWQSRMAETALDALVAVDTRTVVQLAPAVIRYTTTLQYDVIQGRVAQVKVLLPAGQVLAKVVGDAIRDWQVTEAGGQSTLTLGFLRPVESATTVTLSTEQTVAGLPVVAPLAAPQPLGVQRETGTFSVIAEDVMARLDEVSGLRQVNAGAGELASYRFSARPIAVRASLTRVEPEVQVTARVRAALEESRLMVRHELALNVTRAGLYAVELALPLGVTVAEVTGEGIEDWKATNGVLRLGFTRRVLGERTLMVQLEQALTNAAATIELTPVRVSGAAKESAFIGARAVAGLTLKTASVDGAREIPVGVLPDHRDEQLAFRADGGSWRIGLSVERLAPRLVAEVFNLITVGDGLVGGSATLRFAVVNQGVQAFRVRLPRHWRNVEFTGPNLRRTDRQDDVWTLTLQDKAWGAYTLVVTYDHAFDPKQAVIDGAGAHPLEVEREDGTVAVTAAPGLEIIPGPVAEPLRVIDPTELAPTDRALISRPVLHAYRYEGTNYLLTLNVTRHEQVAVLDAVTDRAQLTSVLTPRGEMLTQAGFMVKNNERQYQRFQLPPGATLWGVSVNGEPVKADRDGDWVLVSLPRGADRDQTFAVDLNYAQQVGDLGRLGGAWPRGLEFVAPRTDVPGTYAEWELYTPPARRLSGFGGNMTVARGTTYGLRDGWDEFVKVYAGWWHRFGAALIVTAVIAVFLGSLWVLGRRKGFNGLVQALVVFALLAIMAGMLLPALSKAKAKSNRISSVNNLKNIGLAARIYAGDHGGRMPTEFGEMMVELSTEKILVHPTTGERYTWVGAGKSEEQPDGILAYGPSVEGNREVLLADGSVQQVNSRQFDEILAKELAAKGKVANEPASASTYQMDPMLARRYGLIPKAVGDKLAEAQEQAPAPAAAAAGAAVVGKSVAVPTVAGLRSLKIEIPKSGRAYQFTRVLNLSGEPPTVRFSVMSTKAFILLRTLLQLLAFGTGLIVVWWQWRKAEPGTAWLAVGAGLALTATVSLFIAWRALHLVLIVGIPTLLLLFLAWLAFRYRDSRRARRVVSTTNPPSSPPPVFPSAPEAGATAVLLLLAATLGWMAAPSARAAEMDLASGVAEFRASGNSAARSNRVSVVSAAFTGTTHERVARIEAVLEFASAGTNQTVPLFGSEVAVQEFTSPKGDARLWREGENVGVLLPSAGPAAVRFALLVKLGGDVGRRTLDFRIPPALGTRLSLRLDEPDADVEFPGAVSFSRTNAGPQTRIEAVLGATDRIALAWTPRLRRASESGSLVFVQEAALVTLGNGVAATRSQLEFTTPQGELRSVRVGLPAGQRLLRVSGEQVRNWTYADTNRSELNVELLKSTATARITLETEAALDSLPASVTVGLPRPLDVTRVTGVVAVRGGEELGLTVERATGLERIESAEFARALGGEVPEVGSAWRFVRPDFDLTVRAEVLMPRVEAVVRNQFRVGFDQVSVAAHADYTISRAGVFALRLALPPGARVDRVDCAAMASWSERLDAGQPTLELTLKERTLGTVAAEVTLTRPLTNLPPTLALAGVHPLAVDTLGGFVSVAAEPGVSVKVLSRSGLTEIPVATMPGLTPGGALLAFKLLTATPGATPSWALDVSTETVDSWVRAEVAASVTVGESLASGRSVVRYEIQNAPVQEFRLRVPSAWRNVDITGAGVRRRDQTNTPAGVEWRVELQNKVRGDYRLLVQWEEPRSGTNRLALAGLETLGVERETGTVALAVKGQLQLVPDPAGDALLKIDARELPGWASEAGSSPAVLTYRYLRPGWRLALDVKRFSDAAVLQALVESARFRTVVADDGQMMTQMTLKVRNNGRQNLELSLPPGAQVWAATVDGEPVRPAKREGKLLLPLEGARGDHRDVSIELTYVATGRFPRTSGRVELVSPRLDIPLKDASWDVFLPPDHAYTDFGGTMTYESADLAPVSQDFTLASYRRQELEQLATVESRAEDLIAAARQEIASGRFDNAGRWGVIRSSGLRDESAKRELQVLEETVNQAQSSNLVQAQRDYAANNSLQLGLPTAFDSADRPESTYDTDVAARQVVQLNRAQAVAVSRVTPLRVSLPTRGLRHTFVQVLQTEVDRPLTVSFDTRNERETSWFKTGLLWTGGFLGLWLLAFLSTTLRPEKSE